MNLAAIDIGSNAVRLLIARIIVNKKGVLIKKNCLTRIPLRLGEDTFEDGVISDSKIEKLAKTISSFKLIMELYNVVSFKTIATSALREAKNNNEVIEKIYKFTGIKIQLINGDQEADTISKNLENISDFNQKTFIHVDVGGGSTEVNLIQEGTHILSKSFKLGSVRNLKNKDKKSSWIELEKHLNEIKQTIIKSKNIEGLGTGGNINKCLKLITTKTSDKRSIKTSDLKKFYSNLNNLTEEERIIKFQLKDDRADVIVPAIKIYLTIFEYLAIEKINIPKVGLADGLILNIYQEIKNGTIYTNHHS